VPTTRGRRLTGHQRDLLGERAANVVEAPEWRRHGEYTKASDWYAFGQLLYHVCCGPIEARSPVISAEIPAAETGEPVRGST